MDRRTATPWRPAHAGAALALLVAAVLALAGVGRGTDGASIAASTAAGSHHDPGPARSADLRRGPVTGADALAPPSGRAGTTGLRRSAVPIRPVDAATVAGAVARVRPEHEPVTAPVPTTRATSSRGPPAVG